MEKTINYQFIYKSNCHLHLCNTPVPEKNWSNLITLILMTGKQFQIYNDTYFLQVCKLHEFDQRLKIAIKNSYY